MCSGMRINGTILTFKNIIIVEFICSVYVCEICVHVVFKKSYVINYYAFETMASLLFRATVTGERVHCDVFFFFFQVS